MRRSRSPTGSLRTPSSRELAGVLAHEIAHVRGNDLWIMQLSDTVARLAHLLSYVGLFSLLLTVPVTLGGSSWPLLVALVLTASPTLVTLLQLALARSREYDADLEAATLTGDPEGLGDGKPLETPGRPRVDRPARLRFPGVRW